MLEQEIVKYSIFLSLENILELKVCSSVLGTLQTATSAHTVSHPLLNGFKEWQLGVCSHSIVRDNQHLTTPALLFPLTSTSQDLAFVTNAVPKAPY